MNIDRFKDEHVQIMNAVTGLKALAKAGIAENASEIVRTIAAMSSTIKLHLAAEDRVLYPTLSRSTNPEVARLGTRFQEEMGGIADAYADFAGRWNQASDVSADPEGFRTHANAIFKALHQRIQRENQELYPLAEEAAA